MLINGKVKTLSSKLAVSLPFYLSLFLHLERLDRRSTLDGEPSPAITFADSANDKSGKAPRGAYLIKSRRDKEEKEGKEKIDR